LAHYKIAAGPPGHFLFGNTREIRHDPLRFGLEMVQRYGDIVRIRLLFWPAYLINHPDGVKRVLQENQQNYHKDLYPYRILKPLLGQGLVTNDGESWLQQRRLMQPAFHRKCLAAFGTLTTDATVTMLDQWQRFAERDQPLDVAAEMLRLTLHIAGQALFNIDLSNESHSVGQAVATVNKLLSEYLSAPFPPISIPTRRSHRLQAARRTLDRVVHDIIVQRRQQRADTGDLLSMLLLARDEETGEGMNEQQIRDEVMTLLIAGHETVATALMWTWYLLSQHPHDNAGSTAALSTSLGLRTENNCRWRNWGLCHSCEQHDRAEPLHDPSPSGFLGAGGGIRPRALCPGTSCRSSTLRLLPIRRWPTHMHRQQFCADGDTVGPGYYSAAIPAAPGPRSPGRARGIPFATPPRWPADDAPSCIHLVVE